MLEWDLNIKLSKVKPSPQCNVNVLLSSFIIKSTMWCKFAVVKCYNVM